MHFRGRRIAKHTVIVFASRFPPRRLEAQRIGGMQSQWHRRGLSRAQSGPSLGSKGPGGGTRCPEGTPEAPRGAQKAGVFGRHLLTPPRGVQKGDKRVSEGGGRHRVCFNVAGRFPSKLKGLLLVFYEILIILFVLCVKARRTF